MKIARLFVSILLTAGLVACAVDTTEENPQPSDTGSVATEETQEIAQATGTCGNAFSCPLTNGDSTKRLTSIVVACSSGQMTSVTCKYSGTSSTIVLTPPSSSCDTCSIQTSQGTDDWCGSQVLTSYAIVTCN